MQLIRFRCALCGWGAVASHTMIITRLVDDHVAKHQEDIMLGLERMLNGDATA